MRKYKVRIITLITLFVLTLSAAFFAMRPQQVGAFAATEYRPTTVFSAGTGGTVGATEVAEGSTESSYVEFTLANGGTVNYRHDLALKWQESKGAATYFNVEFALPAINFSTLTLTFESAQENITKDGKTTNAVVFTADANGAVSAAVKNGEEDAGAAVAVNVSAGVTVAFTGDSYGSFTVACNGTEIGTFTNIGGYFMEYLSSANKTARIPLAFKAELKEGAEAQKVVLKSLNGQSFALTDGKIVDNASPVLVVNEVVKSFALGYKFSLSYQEVDVLDESVTVERKYYMYEAPAAGEDATVEDSDYTSLTTSTYFLPTEEGSTEEYVSIRFKLTDDRATDGTQTDEYVYLSWYVALTETYDGVDYIPVTRDANGPSYACIDSDDNAKTSELIDTNPAYLAYQEEVDTVSEGLNAGDGAYFYLPSLRSLISDDNTDYRNLKFNIYYKNQTSASSLSETSLSYNALKFEIEKEGEYSFRVVATDKLGNALKVYDDGRLVTVNSSNVWELDCIPQFNFTAVSTGATIEKPEAQSIGYLDSTYNIEDFEIVALSGYEVNYKLYLFDQDAYVADGNTMPTYTSLVNNPKQIDAKYLIEIQEYDASITEKDAAWSKTDNDVAWKPSSLTFRPQQSGFYFVEAEVTDAVYWQEKAVAYQVIEVRNPIDVIEGEAEWTQSNVLSVVFFSIAAVLLVAIIVLWLVKPSEKTVEEVELSELKGKKKKQ